MSWLRLLPFPLLALGVVVALPGIFLPKDFTEYWSAARVLATGGDPYSGSELLPVQQQIAKESAQQEGKDAPEESPKVVSLWTPPLTPPLVAPVGFLPFTVAR